MIDFLRKYQKTFDYAVISLVAYVTFLVREMIKSRQPDPFIYNLTAILFLVLSAFLVDWLKRLLFQSRYFDRRQKIVGRWIEYVEMDEKPHAAIFNINYNIYENEFTVDGYLFDPEQRLAISRWDSLSVNFIGKNTVYYAFNAEMRILNKISFGTVKLTFLEIEGKSSEGLGFVMDSDPKTKVYSFEFDRLDDKLMNRLIKKNKVASPEDRSKLIVNYVAFKNGTSEKDA